MLALLFRRPLISRNRYLEDRLHSLQASCSQQLRRIADLREETLRLQKVRNDLEHQVQTYKAKAISSSQERESMQMRYSALRQQLQEVKHSLEEANYATFEAQQRLQRETAAHHQCCASITAQSIEPIQNTEKQLEIKRLQQRCIDTQQRADSAENRLKLFRDRHLKSIQRWQLKVCSLRFELEEARAEQSDREKRLTAQVQKLTCQKNEATQLHESRLRETKHQISEAVGTAYRTWVEQYKKFAKKLNHKHKVLAAAILFLQKEIVEVQHRLRNKKLSPQATGNLPWTVNERLWAQQALTAKYREQYFALNSKYMRLRRITTRRKTREYSSEQSTDLATANGGALDQETPSNGTGISSHQHSTPSRCSTVLHTENPHSPLCADSSRSTSRSKSRFGNSDSSTVRAHPRSSPAMTTCVVTTKKHFATPIFALGDAQERQNGRYCFHVPQKDCSLREISPNREPSSRKGGHWRSAFGRQGATGGHCDKENYDIVSM
eukprot:gb/GECG01005081.1/.p1 GENE.gb/GECG01005081.1/~~gb/GECG01005081.1/.p1  ORF type:complete len:495 (+),score=50.76 gb/GECG01005081.1/:1-1485(+)